jgi:hypothetical protein
LVAVAAAITVGVALARPAAKPASPEAKSIVGTSHDDKLVGTRRRDHIEGRGGADRIVGRAGRDVLEGGNGPDRINARDGHQDTIDCGAGHDVVKVDRAEDGVYACEQVVQPSSAQKEER